MIYQWCRVQRFWDEKGFRNPEIKTSPIFKPSEFPELIRLYRISSIWNTLKGCWLQKAILKSLQLISAVEKKGSKLNFRLGAVEREHMHDEWWYNLSCCEVNSLFMNVDEGIVDLSIFGLTLSSFFTLLPLFLPFWFILAFFIVFFLTFCCLVLFLLFLNFFEIISEGLVYFFVDDFGCLLVHFLHLDGLFIFSHPIVALTFYLSFCFSLRLVFFLFLWLIFLIVFFLFFLFLFL